MLNERGSGILLHISSLPSRFGIGDLGPEAYRVADFLHRSRQKYWQILPLNPTSTAHDNSPYMSTSAFAANPLFISPELLVECGLLEERDLAGAPAFPANRVDYAAVDQYKNRLLDLAFSRFQAGGGDPAGYGAFCRDNGEWLTGYALFTALHTRYGDRPWNEWPAEIRHREPAALRRALEDLATVCRRERFCQYLVHSQVQALRDYCARKGIRIIGDLPIYIDYDSADVWQHPGLFQLDASLHPVAVSGVPPDYFSPTGQLWKNPLYAWDVHRNGGFSWWLSRIGRALACTDLVRIDHFRGLVAYWEVPAGAETAIGGRWVRAPAEELLELMKTRFPGMPVIAEDLGIITPDVREVMAHFGLPGMRVLLFAFTDETAANPHAPHNLPENVLLYTGTHDNAPARGWFEEAAGPAGRDRVVRYLGAGIPADRFSEILVRTAMTSVARTVIVPVQDLLGLGMESRMNTPGTEKGNWQWRLLHGQLTDETGDRLRILTEVSGRG